MFCVYVCVWQKSHNIKHYFAIFNCTIQWHGVHTYCCATLVIIHFQKFFPFPKLKTLSPWNTKYPFPLLLFPHTLASTSVLPDLMNLTLLDILYELPHSFGGFLQLKMWIENLNIMRKARVAKGIYPALVWRKRDIGEAYTYSVGTVLEIVGLS